MFYQHLERMCIVAGLDPYMPLMHSTKRNKPALIYDFIDPLRPWADEVMLSLCLSKSLSLHHTKKVKRVYGLIYTHQPLPFGSSNIAEYRPLQQGF